VKFSTAGLGTSAIQQCLKVFHFIMTRLRYMIPEAISPGIQTFIHIYIQAGNLHLRTRLFKDRAKMSWNCTLLYNSTGTATGHTNLSNNLLITFGRNTGTLKVMELADE
jgi:hypothetical protein